MIKIAIIVIEFATSVIELIKARHEAFVKERARKRHAKRWKNWRG